MLFLELRKNDVMNNRQLLLWCCSFSYNFADNVIFGEILIGERKECMTLSFLRNEVNEKKNTIYVTFQLISSKTQLET